MCRRTNEISALVVSPPSAVAECNARLEAIRDDVAVAGGAGACGAPAAFDQRLCDTVLKSLNRDFDELSERQLMLVDAVSEFH